MKPSITLVIILVLASCQLYGQAEQPPPTPAEEQPEVLTRGPVHEAFAEPVNLQVEAGLVAPSSPPANIEEIPPAERPSGAQFVWVPGYWAWDGERNSYIWVSGCWRAAPPGMYWMPGYWAKAPGGWQWVAGFWAPAANTEIEYLPAPPALENVEPPGPPPYEDRIWVPPCWYWYQGQYIRRPGYWVTAQADWIWAPSHYVWTPRGYVFVTGHWDYSLGQRGVLFAPVYFPRHFYGRPGFSYSLSVVVDIGNLEFGLFTYPRYCHYYFGDYYDDLYVGIGIYPWYECVSRYTWYDPIYFHDRWRHHKDRPDWDDYERREYDRRRADRDLRPARTYREMETRLAKLPEQERKTVRIAEPMTKVVTGKTTTFKFEKSKPDARQQISRHTDEVHNFVEQRNHWESQGTGRKAGQPVMERVPSAERKEMSAPSTEHKGPEMKPSERKESVTAPAERKETAPPTERKGPEIKPSERKEIVPPTKEKPTNVSPQEGEQNQPDKVKVPSPPIVGKQGGIFRKGPPSRPADEQKAEDRDTRREKDTRGSAGGETSPKGGEKDTGRDKGGRNRGN